MDAVLIPAGPVVPAAIAARPATGQGSAKAGHSTSDTQSAGSQSSFADVLKQSSQAQTTSTPDGTASKNSATAPATPNTGDNQSQAIGLPIAGGQVMGGPDASMQGAPPVPVVAPVVLQVHSEAVKTPTSSLLSAPNASSPTRSGTRKTTPSSADASQAAATDAAPTAVAAGNAPVLVNVPVVVTKEGLQSSSTAEAGVAKSESATGAATSKSVASSARSTATLRSAGDDSSPTPNGVSDATSPDAGAAIAPAHIDVATSATAHAPLPIDAATNSLSTSGAGATLSAPAIHAMPQTLAPASSSAAGASSLYPAAVQGDASTVGSSDHTTMTATPNVIEVGLSSGSHGWVRVRAEMSTNGDVTASVRAASETAYESLHKELPSISAYLASESVGVTSLSVEHTSSTFAGSADPGGTGQASTGSGSGAQAGGRDSAASYATAESSGLEASGGDSSPLDLNIVGAMPAVTYANASGGWLSVLA